MMQSGLGGDDVLEDRTESAMFGILIPVLEKTVILAAKYVKACGRECITEKDFEYALKYCVMYTVGDDIGSIFPEDWDDDDDDTGMIEMSEEEGRKTRSRNTLAETRRFARSTKQSRILTNGNPRTPWKLC